MRRTMMPMTSLVTLLTFGSLSLQVRRAIGEEVPSCTTTTTTSTTCTGAAAPLAAPPAAPGLLPDPYADLDEPVGQPTPRLHYDPSPEPPGTIWLRGHVVERPRRGLAVAGAILLGVSYSFSVASSIVLGEPTLAIPVIGPALFGLRWSHCDNQCTPQQNDGAPVPLVFLDTIVQTAGLTMLLIGALKKRKVTIYDSPRVSLLPAASPSSVGVAAFGRF